VAINAVRHFEKVNKELWLILSMFVIALMLNVLVDAQRMMLSFYMLPTLGSAYLYGRRHATLTALGSVLMVVLMTSTSGLFGRTTENLPATAWLDLTAWGGMLIVTGYLMGTMYNRKSVV
jgi:hypothetical protein